VGVWRKKRCGGQASKSKRLAETCIVKKCEKAEATSQEKRGRWFKVPKPCPSGIEKSWGDTRIKKRGVRKRFHKGDGCRRRTLSRSFPTDERKIPVVCRESFFSLATRPGGSRCSKKGLRENSSYQLRFSAEEGHKLIEETTNEKKGFVDGEEEIAASGRFERGKGGFRPSHFFKWRSRHDGRGKSLKEEGGKKRAT